MISLIFFVQCILTYGFFGFGGFYISNWFYGRIGSDLKDLILGILLINNGLAVCLWFYLTNS